MFNNKEYIEENKDSIMGIIRSVVVCLHLLLDSQNKQGMSDFFEQELFTNNNLLDQDQDQDQDHDQNTEKSSEFVITNRDPIIIQNNLIINNVSEILFHDNFNIFREKFIDTLYANNLVEHANFFAERLEIARSLPKETKDKVKDLINSLKHGGEKFFEYFFSSWVENEHPATQSALVELMFHYFQVFENLMPNVSQLENDNVNYYENQETEDQEYSYLWGNIHKSRETTEQLELVNQRIKFIQAFKSGVIDQKNQDYIWKFKEQEAEKNSLEEINNLLKFSEKFTTCDFSERLSLTIEHSEEPIIEQFKQKLQKTKLTIC